MAFTRLDDIVVHHASVGPPDAPALVFANSLGTDLRIWDDLLPAFADRWRLVRYDLRGHGLTDSTPGPYSIAGLAADLARLLDHLKVRDALVCGLSIGGMVAQALAASRPDLARALVLMDTAPKIGTPESWQQRIDGVTKVGIAGIAEAILERWFAPVFHDRRPEDLAGYRNMLVRTPAEGYLACCAAIRDADLTAATAQLSQPTLCIAGTDDGATPPDLVRALAGLVPGARFALIPEAGHLPCVEQPAAVAEAMHRFIEENRLV